MDGTSRSSDSTRPQRGRAPHMLQRGSLLLRLLLHAGDAQLHKRAPPSRRLLPGLSWASAGRSAHAARGRRPRLLLPLLQRRVVARIHEHERAESRRAQCFGPVRGAFGAWQPWLRSR